MPTYRITAPDGTVYRVTAPDGATEAEVLAYAKTNAQQPEPTKGAEVPPIVARVRDLAAGAVRGAGSIGATLLTPYDLAAGNTKSVANPERRKAMDEALQSFGADPSSLTFQGAKLASEVAGTGGAGSVLASVLSRIPRLAQAAPTVVDAVRSSGFTAGGATGARGMAARTAGGAVAGGAAAGMVNPDDAGIGAAVGGALPGALTAAGAAGRAVGGAFRSPERRAAERVAQALDMPADEVRRLLASGNVELVPGSRPTVAQALQTPQAGGLERLVSQMPGGEGLKQRYIEQNAARLNALDAVAPVDPRGLRSAQEDFGTAALDAIRRGDTSAKASTRAAYEAVPQDEAALYLPDLDAIVEKYLPRGAFGGRAAVDEAARTAREIGAVDLPAVRAARPVAPDSLASAVRRAGGVARSGDLRGEAAGLAGQHKNLVRRSGQSLDDLAERMAERGYIRGESTDELIEALNAEARGQRVLTPYTSDRVMAGMRDAAMGDAPGAQRVPQKVTLREFDALRKSIGNEQRAAARDPARATEAAALSEMRAALDDRINQVVRGDGAVDEVLPLEWANQLTEAQKLKRAQVEKFRTGPQASAFLRGSDGLPKVQGGEFARHAWSNRAGAASDIAQLKKAIAEHPEVMRQFRSMVTTEGAGTSTAAGNLTNKFARWVENSLPGLRETFDADQVNAMRRIAEDIKRASTDAATGAARGSDTAQKAAGALDIGLLDNALVNSAASRIPLLGQFTGPALDALRQTARRRLANDLANLMMSPEELGLALSLTQRRAPVNALAGLPYRAAPVLAADQ